MPYLRAILVIAIPFVAFWGGVYLMGALSDRDYLESRFDQLDPKDRTPIGLRIYGYDLAAVGRQWNDLRTDLRALNAQRLGLEIDLLFPFLYGGAFALSLIWAWATLGRPLPPVCLIAPVAITVVADWIENLVQLRQLHRLASNLSLQSGWIHVASAATIVKLAGSLVSTLFVIALFFWLVGPGLAKLAKLVGLR